MKITVNVECSPEEARSFLGLPDVKPLQAEMMKIMRDKTIENMKMMEPDKAMQVWGPMFNQGAQQMQDFFRSVMTSAATGATNSAAAARRKK